ncbi:transcriptional regulator [Arthrobacter rhombi]|uniref:transcriptional regulator n=1 Tax=Arthrobacter rhombi TaxID=71253 RepID=UPI003FCF8FDD
MSEINKVLYPIQRFKVMGYLCQVEKSNYGSIAAFTGLSLPEISRTVKTLEEHGYVKVWKDRNGRYPETVVRATETGQDSMRTMLNSLRRYSEKH